jgi:hypothetical protein
MLNILLIMKILILSKRKNYITQLIKLKMVLKMMKLFKMIIHLLMILIHSRMIMKKNQIMKIHKIISKIMKSILIFNKFKILPKIHLMMMMIKIMI